MGKLRWQSPDGKSYDPDLLRLMQTAFDEVWSAQPAVDRTVSESDREALANAILGSLTAVNAIPPRSKTMRLIS